MLICIGYALNLAYVTCCIYITVHVSAFSSMLDGNLFWASMPFFLLMSHVIDKWARFPISLKIFRGVCMNKVEFPTHLCLEEPPGVKGKI